MTNEALVSVVVITYNSAAFVTETLDSIARQTYSNIELVVSDDCSRDDTVEVVRQWMEKNRERFAGCVIRAGEENLGIPKNLNAGIRKASGRYIKIIAGDDLLLPDCIRVNVDGCAEKNSRYLFTWLEKFSDGENGRKFWSEAPNPAFFEADAAGQYAMLLRKNWVYGPLFFCEKAFLEEMGMYDERYRMLEDYPMWLKMTKAGHKLHFVHVPTVAYRISESSVSNSAGVRVVNENYFRCYRQFFYDQIFPELLRRGKLLKLLLHWRDFAYRWLILALGNDRGKASVRLAEYFHQRKYLPGRGN